MRRSRRHPQWSWQQQRYRQQRRNANRLGAWGRTRAASHRCSAHPQRAPTAPQAVSLRYRSLVGQTTCCLRLTSAVGAVTTAPQQLRRLAFACEDGDAFLTAAATATRLHRSLPRALPRPRGARLVHVAALPPPRLQPALPMLPMLPVPRLVTPRSRHCPTCRATAPALIRVPKIT